VFYFSLPKKKRNREVYGVVQRDKARGKVKYK